MSRRGWSRRCASGRRTAGPTRGGSTDPTGVALGIQRLRIIDLETGDQPIYNEDRSVAVVLNGEIYNFQRAAGRARAPRPLLLHAQRTPR